MSLKVFISYSTKDLHIVDFVRSILAGAPVEVFVAEYSVAPGTPLSPAIITAIKQCNLFILLWSHNSRASEWVPQEIGIAIERKQANHSRRAPAQSTSARVYLRPEVSRRSEKPSSP